MTKIMKEIFSRFGLSVKKMILRYIILTETTRKRLGKSTSLFGLNLASLKKGEFEKVDYISNSYYF